MMGMMGAGNPSEMEDMEMPQFEGQGWNPAMGGTPAVMAQPPGMALREGVQGRSFTGEENMEM